MLLEENEEAIRNILEGDDFNVSPVETLKTKLLYLVEMENSLGNIDRHMDQNVVFLVEVGVTTMHEVVAHVGHAFISHDNSYISIEQRPFSLPHDVVEGGSSVENQAVNVDQAGKETMLMRQVIVMAVHTIEIKRRMTFI